MAEYTYDDIINKVVELLKADSELTSNVIKSDTDELDLVDLLVDALPAVVVVFKETIDDSSIFPSLDQAGIFSILCIDRIAAQSVSDMIQSVLCILQGADINEKVFDVKSSGINFIYSDQFTVAYSRDFEITWRYK